MPLYKYVCFHCTYKFELQLLPDDDNDEVSCPRCGCAAIPRPPVLDQQNISSSLQKERKGFAKKMRDATHRKVKDPTLDFNTWLKKVRKEKQKDDGTNHQ